MNSSDFERFHGAITTLAVEHDKEVPDQRVKIWWAELKQYPIEAIEAAFRNLLRTSKFFPKLAEIIEAIEGCTSDRALVAWQTVYEVVVNGRCDIGGTLEFSDQRIQDTVRMIGGWRRLRMMREDEVPFRQKDFVAAYTADVHERNQVCIEYKAPKRALLGLASKVGKPIDRAAPRQRASAAGTERPRATRNEQIKFLIRTQISAGKDIGYFEEKHSKLVSEVTQEAN